MATSPLVVEKLGMGEGQGVLFLRGPLTMENLLLFQNAMRREADSGTVILDLSEVPYIDSAGLGSLVSALVSRQKAGRRVALSGVNERVLRLLEITRVESIFLIFETLDHAIAALSGAGQA